MIKIQNLEGLATLFNLTGLGPEAMQQVLSNIAAGAEDYWRMQAGKDLFTSKMDYLGGIQPFAMQEGMFTLTLVGSLPNMIENGLDGDLDLRDTLLGPNVPVVPVGQRGAHEGKHGKYRSVPFRHGTPGSAGRVGAPMGRAYQGHPEVEDSAALGRAIYKQAKRIDDPDKEGSTRSAPGQGVKYGGRLPEGLAPLLKSRHSTDIYAGMIKSGKKYKSKDQSKYTTFRTISENPETADKWIIPASAPGYGQHLLDKVQDHITRTAPMAFEAYVRSLRGES